MSDPTKYTAAQLRAAMRAWANTLGVCEGYTFSNQIEAPFREIVEDVIESEGLKQSPDPKHLPPRDCLVLYESAWGEPYWMHCTFDGADGEYDEEGRAHGHDDQWLDITTDEPIDPSRVITWRELPEVAAK